MHEKFSWSSPAISNYNICIPQCVQHSGERQIYIYAYMYLFIYNSRKNIKKVDKMKIQKWNSRIFISKLNVSESLLKIKKE